MDILKPRTAPFSLSYLVTSALLATTPMALAQDSAEEAMPVYQVELILFQHADQSATTSEIPRTPEPEISDVLEQDLPRLDASAEPEENYEEILAHWRVLPNEQLLLNDVSQRLASLGAYELIAHTGWLQTAPDVADAQEIDIYELGIEPNQASGSIKLLKRRYLHLAVDVALGSSDSGFGEAFQVFSGPKAAPAINDSRRIRLEKLVYFDQPQFGVIAMIARSEEEYVFPP